MRAVITELRPWHEADAGQLLSAFNASDNLKTQVNDTDLSTIECCREFLAFQLAPASASVPNFAISVDGQTVDNASLRLTRLVRA